MLATVEMLRGAHFLGEMGLTQSRLHFHSFTSAYMDRLISSGWLVFQTKRNDEEGSSTNSDDDSDARSTLAANSDKDARAALLADASRIAEDARASGISGPARASRLHVNDEALQAMLVSDLDLKSGTVVTPSFREIINGCESLFAGLRRMLINPTDPLAGVSRTLMFINYSNLIKQGGMSGAIGSMVTMHLQGYYYDHPESLGGQACRLEGAWPGILKEISRSGQGRPFVDYNPLSTWSMSLTQVPVSRLFII